MIMENKEQAQENSRTTQRPGELSNDELDKVSGGAGKRGRPKKATPSSSAPTD
jgi:hypothetical protein